MILILRGHIRTGFNTTNLYELVKTICTLYPDIKIFIHTWHERANNLSYRHIDTTNNFIVNEELIINYFKELSKNIKKILIDNDKTNILYGTLDGRVGNSGIPMIGWKNYWCGKHKIIDYIYNNTVDHNELVINTRFDILDFNFLENSTCLNNSPISRYTANKIISFIDRCKDKQFDKNTFIINNEIGGVDNIYIGSVQTMHKLITYFHKHLDDILIANSNITNPEKLVFRVNNDIFRSVDGN
jgi:hypothetical protein